MKSHQKQVAETGAGTLLKDNPSFPFDDLDDPVVAALAHVVGQYRAVQASWEQDLAAGREALQELARIQEAESVAQEELGRLRRLLDKERQQGHRQRERAKGL